MSLLTQTDLDKAAHSLNRRLDRPWTGCHHPRNSPKCCNDPLSWQHLWASRSQLPTPANEAWTDLGYDSR